MALTLRRIKGSALTFDELDDNFEELASFTDSPNGLLTKISPTEIAGRSIVGTANQILLTNGNGVADNPTISAVIPSQAEAEAGTDNTKLMTALRTFQAIDTFAGIAATFPVDESAWHPYNKVTNGDAATGAIWDAAIDGALSTITSPTFVDGYEYRFRLEDVQHSAGTTRQMIISMYRETSGNYGSNYDLTGAITNGTRISGYITIIQPRLVVRGTMLQFSIASTNTGGAVASANNVWFDVNTTAQKRRDIRFQLNSTGSYDTGRIIMDKRKAIT